MGSRLQDKVVIITGSSRGIGRACAIRCAEASAKVVVNYVANETAARKTVDDIKAIGGQAVSVQADISSKKDVERLVNETIKAFGKVTGLINNAGVAPFVDFMEMEEKTWDHTMAINAKGLYLTTQAVAREMIKAGKGGRICNITSISGIKATNELQVPYCTSKGAANMFTRVAALSLAKYNITVNAILPGTIETDINRDILNREGVRQGIIDATPLRCIGDVDDIGHAVVYFMSDESKWVTGSLLVIDGGFVV